MQLVQPYEDIVAFGTVAYAAVTPLVSSATGVVTDVDVDSRGRTAITNVMAISALAYQGRYLIALTATNGEAPMHVSVNVPGPSGYNLYDVMLGTKTSLPAGTSAMFIATQRPNESVALVMLEVVR